MKCKVCNGTGMVDDPMWADEAHTMQYLVARMKKCDMCNGTGEVPMTNEEWLHTLNTEQLAEWIADKSNEIISWIICEVIKNECDVDEDDYWQKKSDVVEWLKQPKE